MIDKNRYYSAKAVVDMGILPWRSRMTFTRKLLQSPWDKIFEPIIEECETRRRFSIKGNNILKFIELVKNNKI